MENGATTSFTNASKVDQLWIEKATSKHAKFPRELHKKWVGEKALLGSKISNDMLKLTRTQIRLDANCVINTDLRNRTKFKLSPIKEG